MKKFQKFSLLAAVIFLLCGAVMFGIGIACGGLEYSFTSWKGEITSYLASNTKQLSESYQGVEEIDFDLKYCDVTIQQGNEYSIYSENVSSDFQSYVKNGVWYIKSGNLSRKMKWFVQADWIDNKRSRITIIIPNLKLREVKLNLGAGTLQADGLLADELQAEVGAGEANFSRITAREINMECGMGKIFYGGTIQEEASFQCGMGEINVNLTGKKEEYRYELKCGMGAIRLDGEQYTRTDKKINSQAQHAPEVEIECGMGNVEVSFENNSSL
ncbi:MAG: DUF4097 domain-containing protein [Clostridiales bacterium]|nr:DUF4097 domain-containing protein [Clostridiales bacterium]